MNVSITTKTTVAGLLVLGSLLLAGCLSFFQSNEQSVASQWIVRTHEGLNALESLRTTISERDAALRGYILTGADSYHEAYLALSTEIKEKQALVNGLLGENKFRLDKLKTLDSLIAQKTDWSNRMVLERSKGGNFNGQNLWSGNDQKISDRIKDQVIDVQTQEKQYLVLRNQKLEHANSYRLICQSVLIIASLGILTAAYLIIRGHIREAKRSEELLQTSKVRFTGIFHQSFKFVWLLDKDGELMQSNQTAEAFLGLSRESEVGKKFWDTAWWHGDPHAQSLLREALAKVFKGGAERFEIQATAADGHKISLDFGLKGLLDDDGQMTLIMAEGGDISEFKTAQAALKENEGRLNAIFSSLGEGLYQSDSEGKLVYLNPAGARILGYQSDEVIGRNMHDLIHSNVMDLDHYSAETCPIVKVVRAGTSSLGLDQEDFFRCKDGQIIPVQYYGAPLIVDGQVKGAVVSFVDITFRKDAQRRQALQYAMTNLLSQIDSLEELAPLVLQLFARESNFDAAIFWRLDEASKHLRVVDLWSAPSVSLGEYENICRSMVLGSGENIAGRVWERNAPLWVGGHAGDMSRSLMSEPAKVGLKTSFALPVRSDEKVLGVVQLLAFETLEPNPERLQMMNALCSQFGQFIERKETEVRLRDSEMLFRQLAENISEIFWILNITDRKLLYVSPAFEEVYGMPVSELYADPFCYFKVVVPEDLEKAKRHIHERTMEYRVIRADGSIRWLWSHWTPIPGEDGQYERLCGIVHDISERKVVEKRVSEFYSTVSHELRTPLTSIRASLGLLEGGLAGELSTKQSKLVSIARMESDRLIRLINDILDIRKIEAGKLELKLQHVAPTKLVESTLQSLKSMADEASVKLRSEVEANVLLNCDHDRIVQVITNLVSNAIKFSPKDSEVIVRANCVKDVCRFSVIDTGPGIAADQLSKLFGLFTQLDSSDSRPKGGTGLGLAISKSIVEQHDGKVGVTSELGKGSTFFFELPVFVEPEIKKSNELNFPDSARYGASYILLVEDDDSLSELLTEFLQKESYAVVRASTIAQADECMAENMPKLVILDLHLPDGDGLQWMARMRKDQKMELVPVVVITGSDGQGSNYAGPLLIDWLKKPFDQERLKLALKRSFKADFDHSKVLIVENDIPTREVLAGQLRHLGINALEAGSGEMALDMVRSHEPDLIILDLGMPAPDGFNIVHSLQDSPAKSTPLLIYTNKDLSFEETGELSSGLTRYLMKAQTSELQFLGTVKDLLSAATSV
jgi:PAS domain S-box-containing protein